jgi:curli biogenesis system outer membrane secretion channel CsgG
LGINIGKEAKMKSLNLISFALLASLLAATLPIEAAGNAGAGASFVAEKKRFGVVPFENKTNLRDSGIGMRLGDLMTTELMQNRNYELIERGQLESLLQEQGMSMTGLINQSDAPQVGKIQGLDYLVLGSITEASAPIRESSYTDKNQRKVYSYAATAKVTVSVKVVEVESGRIILAESASADKNFSFGDRRPSSFPSDNFSAPAAEAIKKAGFRIVSQIAPLEPSVIKVNAKAKEVTIDMGRDEGMTVGQKWGVVREGEPLLGRNGEILGVDVIEVAHLTIKSVEARTSIAKIDRVLKNKDGKGNHEVQNGDLLRMQDSTEGRTAGEKFGKWLTK